MVKHHIAAQYVSSECTG